MIDDPISQLYAKPSRHFDQNEKILKKSLKSINLIE